MLDSRICPEARGQSISRRPREMRGPQLHPQGNRATQKLSQTVTTLSQRSAPLQPRNVSGGAGCQQGGGRSTESCGAVPAGKSPRAPGKSATENSTSFADHSHLRGRGAHGAQARGAARPGGSLFPRPATPAPRGAPRSPHATSSSTLGAAPACDGRAPASGSRRPAPARPARRSRRPARSARSCLGGWGGGIPDSSLPRARPRPRSGFASPDFNRRSTADKMTPRLRSLSPRIEGSHRSATHRQRVANA